jgi:hypothetical protein
MRKRLGGHLNLGESNPTRYKARMAQNCLGMVLSSLAAGAKANITIEPDAILGKWELSLVLITTQI